MILLLLLSVLLAIAVFFIGKHWWPRYRYAAVAVIFLVPIIGVTIWVVAVGDVPMPGAVTVEGASK
jgi:hypothetical protein